MGVTAAGVVVVPTVGEKTNHGLVAVDVAADSVFRLGRGADLRGVQQSHFAVPEQQQEDVATRDKQVTRQQKKLMRTAVGGRIICSRCQCKRETIWEGGAFWRFCSD